MIILYVLIPVLILAFILGVVWARLRARGLLATGSEPRPSFRLHYIISPLILLVIYAIIGAVFYNKLSPEQVAYHFQIDGTPDAFSSRATVLVIGLVIQVGLALIAFGIVIGVARSGFLTNAEGSIIKPETLLTLMGNLPAFPQLILIFAMYDIFSYNAYQKHPLPLWLFAVIILVIVTIAFIAIIVSYVIKAGRQAKR